MKLLVFLLFFSFGASAFARDCKTSAGKSLNMSNGNSTANLTDKVTCTYSDGNYYVATYISGKVMTEERYSKDKKLVERSHFVYPASVNGNQRRDGKWEKYHPNGKLKEEVTYQVGDEQGFAARYFDTGKPETVYYYDKRKQLGTLYYNKSGSISGVSCREDAALAKSKEFKDVCGFGGKPSSVVIYTSDNKKSKVFEFENGKLLSKTAYNDAGNVVNVDKKATKGKDGVETLWHQNGKKKQVVRYNADNKLHGKQLEYDTSGKLTREAVFNDGFMTSEKLYFLNGRMKRLTTQKQKGKDKLVLSKVFYDNGKVETEGAYLEVSAIESFGWGFYWDYSYLKPIGKHKDYRSDGTLSSVETYKDGKKHGVTISYQSDGKSKYSESSYDTGVLTRVKTYDGAGKLVNHEEYFKDGSSKKHSVGH